MTDGTQDGTRLSGSALQLFRSGILAFDGEPFVVDDQGRRTSAPAGVEGVSAGTSWSAAAAVTSSSRRARQRRLVPEVGASIR